MCFAKCFLYAHNKKEHSYWKFVKIIVFISNNAVLWNFAAELVLSFYKEDHLQSFKCVSFSLHDCNEEWEGWARKQVNYTSLVDVV